MYSSIVNGYIYGLNLLAKWGLKYCYLFWCDDLKKVIALTLSPLQHKKDNELGESWMSLLDCLQINQ